MSIKEIQLLILVLALAGCVGNTSSESNSTAPEVSMLTGNELPVAKNTTSGFSGSMANVGISPTEGEQISGSNGALTFNYTIFNADNLGLLPNKLVISYNSSTKAWDMGLPRISVSNNPKILNLNGAQYLIDSISPSGIKYLSDKGIHFDSWGGKALSGVCSNSSASGNYFYSYVEPEQKMYFDQNGYLMAVTDNNKNCNIYRYENGRLAKVIDVFNQEFLFKKVSTGVNVWSPKGQIAAINYNNDTDVGSIVDVLGNTIRFDYSSGLISGIRYPTGLQTTLTYKSLPYTSEGKTSYLKVADTVKHKSKSGSTIDETSYFYGENSGNRNFTGYGSYSLSSTTDAMMEQQTSSYSYDVKAVKKGTTNRTTQTFYNFLHLPTKIITSNSGSNYTIENIYETDYYSGKSRKAYYTKPVDTKVSVNGKTIKHTINKYDPNYGTLLDSQEYSLINGALKLKISSTNTLDAKFPWLIKTAVSTDKIKQNVITINSIYDDYTNLLSKHSSYNGSLLENTTYEYYANGLLKLASISDGKQSSTDHYAYSTSGDTFTVTNTNPVGRISKSSFSISINNNPQLLVDYGSGVKTAYENDLLGRAIKVTDGLGHVTKYSYSLNNNVMELPSGYKITEYIDELSRVTDIYDNDGGNRHLSSVKYNEFGEPETETDELMKLTTHYTYDGWGRNTNTTAPDGSITNSIYDDAANTITTTQNGIKVGVKLTDADGNIQEETIYSRSGGQSLRTVYDYDGFNREYDKKVYQDGALYATTQYEYDGNNNVLKETYIGYDGLNKTTNSSYDLFGNPLSSTRVVIAHGKNSTHNSVVNHYNAAGEITSSKDQLGHSSGYVYDSVGRLEELSDGAGKLTKFSYDANGNVLTKSVTTPSGTTNYGYSYDSAGNVTSATVDGKTYTLKYNSLGTKLMVMKYPDGNEVNYEYLPNDLLAGASDKHINKKYAYDHLGNITSISENGHVKSYTYSTVNGVPYTLTNQNLKKGSAQVYSHDLGYDGWMHPATITTHYAKENLTTNNTIDGFGKLKTYSVKSSNNAGAPRSIIYHYDSLGRLTSTINNVDGNEQFTYDANNNVIASVDNHSKSHSFSRNPIDQLTSYDNKAIEYDQQGNMSKDENGVNYGYDKRNNLITVKNKEYSITYDYYPNNLLSLRTVKNLSGMIVETTGFYYSPEGELIFMSSNGNNYTVLDGNNGFVSDNSINSRYPVTSNMSTRLMIDESGTQKTGFFAYSSYGSLLSALESNPLSGFGYNKEQYTDPITGLIYAKARWYRPQTMSFVSRDTLELSNRYAYADGDPIGNYDPSGHASVEQWVGLGASAAGTAAATTSAVLATIAATAVTVATAGAASPSWGAVASLWVSAGATAGATTAFGVGIAAQDSGNIQLAQAMNYTALGLNAVGVISGGFGSQSLVKNRKAVKVAAIEVCPGGSCAPGETTCFTGETMILLAEKDGNKGLRTAIKDIKIGDVVETGKDPK